tara:strand:- start:1234 stop:1398 length:165 start_codon:yes stop_codon:yes gene_type:complete
MLNNKKSQGISIRIIIITVIGLIVLVILIALLTGKLGIFGTKVGDAINSPGAFP